MVASLFLIFLLLIHSQPGSADYILQHIVSHEDLHKFDQKVWLSYPDKFLHFTLSVLLHRYSTMVDTLCQQYLYSGWFLNISQMKEDNLRVKNNLYPYLEVLEASHQITKNPTGEINYQNTFVNTVENCPSESLNPHTAKLNIPSAFVLVWSFHLDSRLSFNMTFFHLNLPFAHHKYGSLVVNNKPTAPVLSRTYLDKCSELETSLATHRKMLTFSGWHPIFNLYTAFDETHLSLCVERNLTFKLNVFFKTIDKGILVSEEKIRTYSFPLRYVFLKTNFKVYSFLTIVSKRSYLVMDIKKGLDVSVRVFDGPSFFADTIKPLVQGRYVASTFQSLILVGLPFGLDLMLIWPNRFAFEFRILEVGINTSVVVYDQSHLGMELHIPGVECPKSPCLLNIKSLQFETLNVTIQNMLFTGPNTHHCSLAGFASFEQQNKTQKELILICPQENDFETLIGRSLYSVSSTFVSLFYWYDAVVVFNMTLRILPTMCSVVFLDPCQLQHFCHFDSREGHCGSMLRNSTKFADILLQHKYLFAFTYLPRESSCTILLISQSKNMFHVSRWHFDCQFTLIMENFENKGSSIDHILRARFDSHTPGCFQGLDTEQTHNKEHFPKQNASLSRVQRIVDTEKLTRFISWKTNAPVRANAIRFLNLLFVGESSSWYEIIVNVSSDNEIPEDTKTFYIEKFRIERTFHPKLNVRFQAKDHFLWVSVSAAVKYQRLRFWLFSSLESTRFKLVRTNKSLHRDEAFHQFMLTFCAKKLIFPMSFVGTLREIGISRNRKVPETEHETLSVMWTEFEGTPTHNQGPSSCVGDENPNNSSLCLKFCENQASSSTSAVCGQFFSFYGKIVRRKAPHIPHIEPKSPFLSWREAAQFCDARGAHLFRFYSRREQEGFISLVKLSKYVPPLIAIYIDLTLEHKVCMNKPNNFLVKFDVFS